MTGLRRRDSCSGYSLLELFLVMGVILMTFTIVLPRMAGFTNAWSLDTEANRMRAKIRQAQQLAITKQKPHRVGWNSTAYSIYEYNGTFFSAIENLDMRNNVTVSSTTFTVAGTDLVDFDQFGAPSEGGSVLLRDPQGKTMTLIILEVTGKVNVL